jgi:TolA-binding protein
MKRILVWFLILGSFVAAARAQDDGTQQQLNELNGRIQNLLETQAVQGKRIDALEKEIARQSQPAGRHHGHRQRR